MESNQEQTLLGVPAGLENLILLFVSSGDEGLKDILNLRQVCKTTKSWVDNLPKAQSDIVFSRAQLKESSELESLCPTSPSPLPFEVKTLTLNTENFHCLDLPEHEKKMSLLGALCAFWKSKLETLILDNSFFENADDDPWHYTGCTQVNDYLFQLMESPCLLKLQLHGNLGIVEGSELPSCFQKVTELTTKSVGHDFSQRNEFYSQLKNNPNLRVLNLEFEIQDDMDNCADLIDHKKDNVFLQMSLECSFLVECNLKCSDFRNIFRQFGKSVVSSKSTIRLRLQEIDEFFLLSTELLPIDSPQLLSLVESVVEWTPREETLNLLENLPRLERIEHLCTDDSAVDFERLTFPPTLKWLRFTKGFPARANFPKSLTCFALGNLICDLRCLVDSLKFLAGHCPELVTLEVTWKLPEEKVQTLNFQPQTGQFSKLRHLRFGCENLKEEDLVNFQVAFNSAFDWRNLELHSLHLDFNEPVVDEEILRPIFEGPSKNSLLEMEIAKLSLTPEALLLRHLLNYVTSQNQRRN